MRHLALAALGLFLLAIPAAASASGPSTSDGVACRTHSTADGMTELSLKWEGDSAKGTLSHTGASGNVTTVTVHAERHDGMIIADDVFQTDLVSHAAVIRVQNGKKYMRTESTWLACE